MATAIDPAALVSAVRAYAVQNYEKDGWDFLVECWSDQDILDAAGAATTPEGAIAKVRKTVKLLAERRDEVRAEIF
jgi:hypothetical protein